MTNSVPAIISKNVGNTLTNYKTWGGILYNVKDNAYGAKGDSATDDTAAIQAAINAAVANLAHLVYFPPGTYKVTALTNTSKVIFVGDYAEFSGINATIHPFGRDSINKRRHPLLQNANFPLSSNTAENITVTGFPEFRPCFDGDGFLWVPCHGNRTTVQSNATKIDTVTGIIVGVVNTGLGPYACAYDPINDRIWCFNSGTEYNNTTPYGGTITVINAKTLDVVTTITMSPSTVKLGCGVYEPETQSMWTGDSNGTSLYKININTFAITSTVTIDTGCADIAYCPVNGYLYASCYTQPSVVVVNPTTAAKVGASITGVGANPVGIVYEPKTRSLVVTDNVGTKVTKIDPSTNTSVATIATSAFDPYGICYDPKTETVLTMIYSTGHINQIDPVTNTRLYTIPTLAGGGCQGMISDPKTGAVFVMGNGGQKVGKIYLGDGRASKEYDASSRHYANSHIDTIQNVSYAASLTIDASKGSVVLVGAMTADLTLAVPINGKPGQILRIRFKQDATGGRTVYSAGSILGMSAGTADVGFFNQTGNTANKQIWVHLLCDDTNSWQKITQDHYY